LKALAKQFGLATYLFRRRRAGTCGLGATTAPWGDVACLPVEDLGGDTHHIRRGGVRDWHWSRHRSCKLRVEPKDVQKLALQVTT
jgi:hypothetical protein